MLTIALPKGRIAEQTLEKFEKAFGEKFVFEDDSYAELETGSTVLAFSLENNVRESISDDINFCSKKSNSSCVFSAIPLLSSSAKYALLGDFSPAESFSSVPSGNFNIHIFAYQVKKLVIFKKGTKHIEGCMAY